ncbi:ribosomal protein hs6-type [Vairimorpha apis BRL 01]|uniref:Ribosomal protein hs6-type n=1 Tax=Vairimorpha apis BRL 01 TaxID=1037528 RepID=T0MK47_9MICR|nr:ribosomal protein hs6-type [Vairimorpha apis BRL 01]
MNLTIEKPKQLINTNIYKNFQHEDDNYELQNFNELESNELHLKYTNYLIDLTNKVKCKFTLIKIAKTQNKEQLINTNIYKNFQHEGINFYNINLSNSQYVLDESKILNDLSNMQEIITNNFTFSPYLSNSLDNLLEQEKKYLFSKKPFDEKNDFNYLNEIKSEKTEYGRKRFFSQVEYFNNLKSGLSKVEILQMINDLDNCNIDFVFKDTKKLAVGSKSNKIMQDAIKIMSGDEISKTYDCLEYDIVPICSTKHGAYTIQTLLNYSTNKHHRRLISKYFKKEGEFLLAHDIGNYTFQKLLTFDPNLKNVKMIL